MSNENVKTMSNDQLSDAIKKSKYELAYRLKETTAKIAILKEMKKNLNLVQLQEVLEFAKGMKDGWENSAGETEYKTATEQK